MFAPTYITFAVKVVNLKVMVKLVDLSVKLVDFLMEIHRSVAWKPIKLMGWVARCRILDLIEMNSHTKSRFSGTFEGKYMFHSANKVCLVYVHILVYSSKMLNLFFCISIMNRE